MRKFRLFSISIIAAVTASFFMVPGAGAEVKSITVAVDGMSCPFCAYGVEKRLKRVEGVGVITISMKEGTAFLSAKKGESIKIGEVPPAVKDAGFTPGTMRIVAVGMVKADKDRLFLRSEGEPQGLLLTDMDEKIRAVLLRHAENGTPVTVKGIAHRRSDDTWTLSPEAIEGISEGKEDAE